MNRTIENFIKSLEQIEESDFTIQRVTLKEDEINVFGDKYSTYENNFVTKLNEKYAILNHIGDIIEPNELIRQFQIPKRFVYSADNDPKIEKCVNEIYKLLGEDADLINELQLIPDFIIHKNQTDKEFESQRLIAEVKTENTLSYKKFVWDFFKLNIYVEKFNFQNGVFLSINTKQASIESFIDNYIQSGLYLTHKTKDVYIIIKENFSSDTMTTPLWEYIYQNGRKQ